MRQTIMSQCKIHTFFSWREKEDPFMIAIVGKLWLFGRFLQWCRIHVLLVSTVPEILWQLQYLSDARYKANAFRSLFNRVYC